MKKLSLSGKFNFQAKQYLFRFIPMILCASLFSIYALFFAAVYNGEIARKYVQTNNFKSAIFYYKEANRLDPQNSKYLFELSKLYYGHGKLSKDQVEKKVWLTKAMAFGESSIDKNRYYPPQMKTLVKIYREAEMPLKNLEYAQKLVLQQRCDRTNYELLARAYIDAAKYYKSENKAIEAKELLLKCLAMIKEGPYYKDVGIESYNLAQKKYPANKYLGNYFIEASNLLETID
jgi:tetratricopeptide (TPR) repeat protein